MNIVRQGHGLASSRLPILHTIDRIQSKVIPTRIVCSHGFSSGWFSLNTDLSGAITLTWLAPALKEKATSDKMFGTHKSGHGRHGEQDNRAEHPRDISTAQTPRTRRIHGSANNRIPRSVRQKQLFICYDQGYIPLNGHQFRSDLLLLQQQIRPVPEDSGKSHAGSAQDI